MKANNLELNKELLKTYGVTEKEALEVLNFVDELIKRTNYRIKAIKAVSYTHLTLPTICSV